MVSYGNMEHLFSYSNSIMLFQPLWIKFTMYFFSNALQSYLCNISPFSQKAQLSINHLTIFIRKNQLFILSYLVPKSAHHCVVQSLSQVWLFATPWTVARQAPPSMGFSRQEYWSGLPCPPPGDLPDPGIKQSKFICKAMSLDIQYITLDCVSSFLFP